VLEQMENVVLLEGHVNRPGGFAWREGLRATDVLPGMENMLPQPDLDYALIVREGQPSRRIQVLPLALAQAFANPGGAADTLLQARDRILVFGQPGARTTQPRQELLAPVLQALETQANRDSFRRIVEVRGNVKAPGRYPLVDGMTAGQLIDAAGGFSEGANAQSAELTRATINADTGRDISYRVIDLQGA